MLPPIITSLSSTGTGKTTLLVHLAYLLAKNGLSVALIELDNRNSFRDCCGLSNPCQEESTAAILSDDFDGNYPFVELWSEHLQGKAVVLQADRESLEGIARQLTGDPFGVFRLKERLQQFSIDRDAILIDAPGQQGQLSLMALCAATHLILTVEMTKKCISDIDAFYQWLYRHHRYLGKLPEVVGIVPGRYNHDIALQRNTMAQFPDFAQKLGTQCFAPIRHSPRFLNAYAAGLPIHLDSPGVAATEDFTRDGNFFKSLSDERLKGLNAKQLKSLKAIAPELINIVKQS
jgi:chromosome partitioning protein